MCSHPILCTAVYISTGCQPPRGQLNRENEYFSVPARALRIWSPKTASAVLSRVSLIILHCHTQAESHACYTRNRVNPEFIGSRNCPRVRLHRVSSTGLKVVPVTDATFEGRHGSINVQLSFPNCLKKNQNGLDLLFSRLFSRVPPPICMYVCMYVWSSHIAEYGSTG